MKEFYNRTAPSREKWKRRNRFYHQSLQRYFSFVIAPNSRVLEIGCGLGDLLNAMKPQPGVGVDFRRPSSRGPGKNTRIWYFM